MGVFQSTEENASSRNNNDDDDSNYLLTTERLRIKTIHNDLYRIDNNGGVKVSFDVLTRLSPRQLPESVLELLGTGLVNRKCREFEHFQQFVVDLTRFSAKRTIETCWDLLSNSISEPNNCLSKFISFAIDLATFTIQDTEGTTNTRPPHTALIERMEEMFHSVCKRLYHQYNESDETTLDLLFNWIYGYAPCLPKLIESVFAMLFFDVTTLPSFKPYCSAYFDNISATVSVLDVIPLSWYVAGLQGKWQRLYTTMSDGLSFNRLMHHILGYEVLFVDFIVLLPLND